jgi:hypothetical protein
VSFIFGGETGLTYEEVQQQRERARELARLLGGTPKNVGEGLNYLGMAIASRMAQNRANRGETALRDRYSSNRESTLASLFGGSSAGGESVFTSGSTGGVGAQGDSAAVAGIALDSEAPTAGLRHMLPSTDPDLNDPRRSQFATAAPRVDDPNVFTTDVVGNTAGVNPELLRNLGNSAEQAFGPGGIVTVSSGRRYGPAGGSDHNSGEAADFNMAPFEQEAPISTDPRYFDMARVAAADPYPVRAVGIGDDYMGHAYNHFGTGEGQGIPTARTWSDWNTGAELARSGRNSADVGGAGDPNYQFAAEIQNILNTDRIPLGGGSEGTMVAQAPQVETTASTRTPATGGIASQVRGGLVDRFTGQLGVDPQQAEMLADAFLLNMEDESGLVPDMIERVPNVHGTRGRGLYQLTGSRRDAYERLYGDDYSINNQLDFLVSELQGPESRAWNAISGAGNTGEAAAAIVTDFLRPAAQHRDRRVAEYLGGRMPSLETTASASNPADAPSSDIGAATVAALEATSPAPQPRQGGAPMQPRQQNPIVQALMNIQPNNVLMGDVGSMPGGPQSPVVLDREGNAMPNPMLRPDAQRGMAAGGVTGAVQQAAQSGGGIGGVIQSLLGGGQQQSRQSAPQPAPMPAQGGVAPAQPPAGGGMPAPVASPQAGGAPAPAQSGQPDLANIPLSALMEAAGNPMLTDTQRSVAQMLLEQRLQQPDPMDAIELERAQIELDQLRDPEPETTDDIREYEYARDQGFTGTLQDFMLAQRRAQNPGAGPQVVGDMVMIPDPESPSGYRLEPIPGGETAREAEQAEEQQALRDESTVRTGSIVLEDIGRVRDRVESSRLPTTGWAGSRLQNVPGTAANDVRALTQTIRANIGFDRLQQMRESSPTGGALGNVTVEELARLESVLGNLEQSQSEQQFLENLDRLERIYVDMMERVSPEFAAEMGFEQGRGAPSAPPASTGAPTSLPGPDEVQLMSASQISALINSGQEIPDDLLDVISARLDAIAGGTQ